MTNHLLRLGLAVLAAVVLTGPVTALAGETSVKAGRSMAPPAWPVACKLAMKQCRIIRSCQTEHVADCSSGKCQPLYQLKRVCRCRVMCRWPGRPNCTIHAQCPNDV